MAGLNAHNQRPSLPGASAAGATCAKAADLFPSVSDLGVAIDGWMAGIGAAVLHHVIRVLHAPRAQLLIELDRRQSGELVVVIDQTQCSLVGRLGLGL